MHIVDLPPSKRSCLLETQWSQDTYWGRLRHFIVTVNPLNLLASNKQLDEAAEIVCSYKKGIIIPQMTVEELWRAKRLYDSAHHPQTGERIPVLGRMSAQVPVNMVLIGGILSAYNSARGVAIWQILNQTFNALVNYSNRSCATEVSSSRILTAYATAVTTSCFVAYRTHHWANIRNARRMLRRCLPYFSGAAANVCNVTVMRSHELSNGITVFDDQGNDLARSRMAASLAILAVIISREVMALPVLTIPPVFIEFLEKRPWYKTFARFLNIPLQALLSGAVLTITTPSCCAMFPQTGSIKVKNLEHEARSQITSQPNPPEVVFYNKGL